MQTITTFLKLFISLLLMVLLGTSAYAVDIESDKNGTSTMRDHIAVVESINNGEAHEGDFVIHHVILNTTPIKPTDFNLTIENISTQDNDYDHAIRFTHNVPDFVYVGTTLTVPAGVREFDIYVRSNSDEQIKEEDEEYKIILDGKEAIGTIHNVGV